MEKCEANSSSPFPTKLCLICIGIPEDGGMDDCGMDERYYVFILDPTQNSDGFIPRVPDLMFQGLGSRMTFCALNSSIYMFDSCAGNEEGKSVYTCDLSAFLSEKDDADLNVSTLKDNSNSLLQPAPPMLGFKEQPASVATPGGQIIVFSRRIYFPSEFRSRPNRVDFELYDPLTKSWRVLPRLCPRREKGDSFRITAYSFLSESLFCVVCVMQRYKSETFEQTFALDLEHDQESLQWNRLDISSLGLNDHDNDQFFVIDEELYLTRGGVRRRGDGCRLLNIPCSYTPEFNYNFRDASLMNVSSNRELRFCSVESMFSYHKVVFYTTVDAWCCDLSKYDRDMTLLSATRNTFKFLPKVEETLDCFFPNAILPIGGDAAVTSNSSL